MIYRLIITMGIVFAVITTLAQDNSLTVINRGNIETLGTALEIDFATAPDVAGEIASGWLRVSPDGLRVVTINLANDLLLWDTMSGELLDVYQVQAADGINANMLDAEWGDSSAWIHSIHTDGMGYQVAVYDLTTGEAQTISVPVPMGDMPVRVWTDNDPGMTWLEVTPGDSSQLPYVLQLDVTTGEIVQQLDSAPDTELDAIMRIGRMPAPLAVTSTEAGLAQLWNLEDGTQIGAVQVDGIPMFGHINGSAGRRLAWRDPASMGLNILDFESGVNQAVTVLNGTYYQALLLVPDASVIIGVNADLAPIVVAWDVATGELIDLGEYRTCGRTPDMVQISESGTTLVIGCDTGLDIWRIGSDM